MPNTFLTSPRDCIIVQLFTQLELKAYPAGCRNPRLGWLVTLYIVQIAENAKDRKTPVAARRHLKTCASCVDEVTAAKTSLAEAAARY